MRAYLLHPWHPLYPPRPLHWHDVALPLLVFICGALYEAACVGWVHFSERGKPLPTALFSMLAAAATVTGILDSVRDWRLAPAFVVGYGAGSYVAVAWKRRRAR